jgi:hypothetical protein
VLSDFKPPDFMSVDWSKGTCRCPVTRACSFLGNRALQLIQSNGRADGTARRITRRPFILQLELVKRRSGSGLAAVVQVACGYPYRQRGTGMSDQQEIGAVA